MKILLLICIFTKRLAHANKQATSKHDSHSIRHSKSHTPATVQKGNEGCTSSCANSCLLTLALSNLRRVSCLFFPLLKKGNRKYLAHSWVTWKKWRRKSGFKKGEKKKLAATMHYGTKPGHFETSIIHFPTSEGVSEVSELAQWRARAKWAS